jgi:ATP-binding cassette subfamily C protein
MQKYTFKYILENIIKHKKELISANIISLLAVLLVTPVPLLVPLLVDEILLDQRGKLLNTIDWFFSGTHEAYFYILIVVFITIILRGLFFFLNTIQFKIFTIISKNIVYKIRQDLLNHISKISLKEYESFGGAKISSLMIIDVGTIDLFISNTVSRFIISILSLIGTAIVLLYINWKLGLFILILNPIILIFTIKLSRKASELKKEENKKIAIFQESLSETLDLFRQVRASNEENKFISKLDIDSKNIMDRSIDFEYKSKKAMNMSFFGVLAGFEIFRATGIMMVFYSDLSIGLMLAIFGYLWVVINPLNDILKIQYSYQNAKVALNRINSIFQMQSEPEYPHNKNPFLNTKTNSISIENLSFSYIKEKSVLTNINMQIKKGEKVAIIGTSGNGKTTLASLIVGFYQPDEGDIKYDGVSYKEIGLDVIRENVFLVLQNPLIFNNSFRFNITFGKDISDEKIQNALKIAQLKDFVNDLKEGLDTHVGTNGIKLSGGQRQRLSIARMILADPNIVILDESTSSLDVKTENILFHELSLFLKERTTIIIAHRLSTITKSDHIYVLDKGMIVEDGSYDQLMENERTFAEFFKIKDDFDA